MSRLIIQDPIFGDLIYYSSYLDPQPVVNRLCDLPFSRIDVRKDGSIAVCCTLWNPAIIGNILQEELTDIWGGYKVSLIRKTILENNYRYCNLNTCEYINDVFIKNGTPMQHNNTPDMIVFILDDSCNLQCPSCRTSKISLLDNDQKSIILEIARKVISSVFEKPHYHHKNLVFDGSGEVFGSQVYRELFETEEIFNNTEKWPNLRFTIMTNGVMMTEKIQKKYSNLFNQISTISISIDAGDKEAYDKVRIGGDWELLWKNLNYLYRANRHRADFNWIWNLVVQRNNFETIPALIRLAARFPDILPHINITRLLNWDTFSDAEYLTHAIHLESHPLYYRYKEIMNLPIVKNYTKITVPGFTDSK